MEKQRGSSGSEEEGAEGAGLRPRSQGLILLLLLLSRLGERDLGPASTRRPCTESGGVGLRGGGSLTFHGILLGSHDVDEGALQGVHVQAVVHSGAVLQNTQRGGGVGKQRCKHSFSVLRFSQINRPARNNKQTRVVARG